MNIISRVLSQYISRQQGTKASEIVRKADPKNLLGSGQVHPVLKQKTEQLIERAAAEGLSLYVVEGHRSFENQAKIPAANTNAKPGYSFHNYGLAVDLAFRNEKGQPSWSEEHNWQRLGELGKELGLEWGGDWKRLVDRPHFQLTKGYHIGQIRQFYEQGKMPYVWGKLF